MIPSSLLSSVSSSSLQEQNELKLHDAHLKLLENASDLSEISWKFMDEALRGAVLKDEAFVVKAYLNKGYPIDRVWQQGTIHHTLLSATAEQGSIACLELLLDKGVDYLHLNVSHGDIASHVLQERAEGGFVLSEEKIIQMLTLLLDAGFPIGGHPEAKKSPLIKSIEQVSPTVAGFLLENNASVNLQDHPAPMEVWAECAFIDKKVDAAEKLWFLLVQYGCDAEKKNAKGYTPFLYALMLEAEVGIKYENRCSAFLLNQGVDLCSVDGNGNNALHILLKYQEWYDNILAQTIGQTHPELFLQKNSDHMTPFDIINQTLQNHSTISNLDIEEEKKWLHWQSAAEAYVLLLETSNPSFSKHCSRRRL